MLTVRYQESSRIFVGAYSGVVDIHQIREGLEQCYALPDPVRVIWDLQEAEVGYGLEEVSQLGRQMMPSIKHPGSMAFVYGEKMFIKAVVESVRETRQVWQQTWELFENVEDAETWLLSR